MIREVMLAGWMMFISIISLVLTIILDLEIIQSDVLLCILTGLVALLILLVAPLRLDLHKGKLSIDAGGDDNQRKKIKKIVHLILVFSIIAEAFLILLLTHIVSITRISAIIIFIVMISAYSFLLLRCLISLHNAEKGENGLN